MEIGAFRDAAAEHNVIPLCRAVAADTLTPVALYLAARRAGRRGFLFESVEGGRHVARYSIVGVDPRERLAARGRETFLRDTTGAERALGLPLHEALKERLRTFRPCGAPGLPRITGGYVGYLGSNAAALLERLPVRPDPFGLPDACLYRFDDLMVYDHVRGEVLLLANAHTGEHATVEEAFADARSRVDGLSSLLETVAGRPMESASPALPGGPPDAERSRYLAAVERAQRHIRDGDLFQIVLSVQERLPFGGDPFEAYRRLRRANPSPYHFFLDQEEAVVFGASPEMLARVEGRAVELRPIAGTRPRGADEAGDAALERDLLADEKEAAEHVMLVDLGRNDAGRVCEYGSVEVSGFRTVERYSHVMHLVSRVTGTLREGVHPVDAFFAAFPAGTVSGAPKIRALEILNDLEPAGRGVYSGAVGYFDYRGNLDSCIAIRTVVVRDGVAQVQAGAGIVADSVPEREFAECGHKMAALKAALGRVGRRTSDADRSIAGSSLAPPPSSAPEVTP